MRIIGRMRRSQLDYIRVVVNGEFYNWNVVYLGYCDGGSFSGFRIDPVDANGILQVCTATPEIYTVAFAEVNQYC